jgi:septum formation protein
MLRLPVQVLASDVDESVPDNWEPHTIVEELAVRKAAAVQAALNIQDSEAQGGTARQIIVGSDTIVVLNGEVLGKPRDQADAVRMLRLLQGRSHQVFTGLACLDTGCAGCHSESVQASGSQSIIRLGEVGQYRIISRDALAGQPESIVGHTVSRVAFSPMSEAEIQAYVETGDPLDKAGSYGVQGLGSVFIEKIEGDFYSIMGLPLGLLYRVLLELGVSPLGWNGNKA